MIAGLLRQTNAGVSITPDSTRRAFKSVFLLFVLGLMLAPLVSQAQSVTIGIQVWYQDAGAYDQNAPFCEGGDPCEREPGVEVCVDTDCKTSTSSGSVTWGLTPAESVEFCLGDSSWPAYRVNSGSAAPEPGMQITQGGRCLSYTVEGSGQTKAMYVQSEGILRAYALEDTNPTQDGIGNDTPLDGWQMSVTSPALNAVTGPPDIAGRASMLSFDIEIGDGTNTYEVCQTFEPGWAFSYACRGSCGPGEQLTPTVNDGTKVCVDAGPLAINDSGAQNPDYTVIFGNVAPPEPGFLAYSPVTAVPVGGGFVLIALGLLMAGVAFVFMRRSGTSGHMAAIVVLGVGGLAVSLSGANLVHKAWAGADMIPLDIPSGGVVEVPPGDWSFVNNTGIDQTIVQLRLPFCDNIFVAPRADTPFCEVGLVLANGDMCRTSTPLTCSPGPDIPSDF